jgi:type VI secretion system protein ImpC
MSEATQEAQAEAAVETQEDVSLLDQIIDAGRIGRDDEQRAQSRQQIATLVDEVMNGEMRVSKNLEATINARIADIDALLSKQLNALTHTPDFQQLEGSWRGRPRPAPR